MKTPTAESTPSRDSFPISAAVSTVPCPTTPTELYLDLMKRVLTRSISAKRVERHTLRARFPPKRFLIGAAQRLLRLLSLELVRTIVCTPQDYIESGDAARNRCEDAETMLGILQMDNMQFCIEEVLRSGVPGDLLEAGVWRGGMTVFMRACLRAHGIENRHVWVADSFSGLPEPGHRLDTFGWREGDMAASLQEVKGNFARFGLLDDQVQFIKGFFSDTLPEAPISMLSILRIDSDLYQSTLDALNCLYPKLSPGGFAIFDDYQNLPDCRRAIDEYRQANEITESITSIDTRAVYWQKRR